MPRMLLVNLPVADLQRSITLFTGLGFKLQLQFTNETTACIVICETIFALLVIQACFAEFMPRAIGDSRQNAEVLLAGSRESRE